MEFDLTWILMGLPVAFALGWFASRMDMRQLRIQNREDPKAYFKGLNFLLNEQQDQAIDAFVQAVQNDPDTSELHFALGNLFRRRGEYDRAVKVHAHLVARADLSRADHERALQALSLDYLRAGLLDRAEEALRALEGTAYESQARRTRLMIYERSREWDKAQELAERMEQTDGADLHVRRAHHWCEMAEQTRDQDHKRQWLDQALRVAPTSPRAHMALAQLQEQSGEPSQALDTLLSLHERQPEALVLQAAKLAELALATGREARAVAVLRNLYEQTQSVDVVQALARLAPGREEAQAVFVEHLKTHTSLIAATQWMASEKFEHEQYHPEVQKALESAAGPLRRYRCGSCGFEARQYFWQCPGCQSWDSYPYQRVEEL